MANRRAHFPEFSDEQLVVLALLGDLEAFDELVRRYRVAVTLVARQVMGCREAAEDVAQEAFLIAFKALPQLDHPAKFPGWLCAITRHRALRAASRGGRSEPVERSRVDCLLLEHSRELAAGPAGLLEQKAEREAVTAALERLPAEYRTVLWLRYYEEWPVKEIAAFLALPVTTVKWRLHQGREMMRRKLGPEKGDSHE